MPWKKKGGREFNLQKSEKKASRSICQKKIG